MIILTVKSFHGAPVAGLAAGFDERGGTIGRDGTNRLVLPDEHRDVSRLHAEIVFRGGAYALIDRGSNASSLNGELLENGRESALQDGDEMQMGGYVIGVSAMAPSPAPSAPVSEAAPVGSRVGSPVNSAAVQDPFAGITGRADSLEKHFGPLAAHVPSGVFGGLPLSSHAKGPARNAGGDFTSVLGDLLNGPSPTPPTESNSGPDLKAPWQTRPLRHSLPEGTDFSHTDNAVPPSLHAPLSGFDAPRADPLPHRSAIPQANLPAKLPANPPARKPPDTDALIDTGANGTGGLADALRDGLGVDAAMLPWSTLDEGRVRLIGLLLRSATRGAVELLQARAAFKSELRAQPTLIAGRENNPLKFSPTVESALQHLLVGAMPGYQEPGAAMQEAFDDLHAHQLAVVAGMRAAIEGVIARFEPAVLEGTLRRRPAFPGLLPFLSSTRKARLWEQFESLYAQLSAEAADDFEELFGVAFRRACQAQIDALPRTPSRR